MNRKNFFLRIFNFFILNNFSRVSLDFFYEPPSWYKDYTEDDFPLKIVSLSYGLSLHLWWEPDPKSINDSRLYNGKNMFQPLSLFRVIIHSPEELPYRAGHHFFLGENDVAGCRVASDLRAIDKSLESWTPEQRNCFIDGEKNLKFFKIYTKANCEHECLSQAVLKTCGCVPFYMIREFWNYFCWA